MAHRRGLAPVIGLVLLLVAGACSGSDDAAEDASSGTSGSEPVVAEAASDGGRADNIEPSGRDDGETETDPEGEVAAAAPPPDTLVWVVATEPPDLHLDDPANGLTVTSWIRQGLFESLFGVGPDLTYHPELLAGEPTIIPQDDASVIIEYELRRGLTWSDGTPLTAEDVAYTHRIITEGCTVEGDGSILDNSNEGCVYQTTSRLGYDQVTNFEVVDETDFIVTMAGFYPDWRRLYGPVFAAHAFGDDARVVNRSLRNLSGPSGTLPSSGPLVFERWDKGVSMTLTANPEYHGSTAPQVEADGPATIGAVRVDFVPDPQERVDALIEGRADLLLERIRPGQSPLFDTEGVATATVPSLDYDHWGLNLLNPHLAQSQVRQAIAVAIDKQAVVDTVFDPNVEVGVQDNTYWLADQPAYGPTQSSLTTGDPDAAKALLAEAGYQPGDDGVFRHPTLGPLRLRVTTIGGDPLREAAQEVLIGQLADAGIAVEADNPAGGRFFQQGPFSTEALAASASGGESGDASLWDIAQFGWAGGPWPGAQSGVYRNGSPGNPYGFSNAEFEVQAFECDAVVDDAERADCYNDLDRFVTTLDNGEDGLFMIPLHQRPLLVASRSDRFEAPGQLIGAPRGGPLVSIVDIELAEN